MLTVDESEIGVDQQETSVQLVIGRLIYPYDAFGRHPRHHLQILLLCKTDLYHTVMVFYLFVGVFA